MKKNQICVSWKLLIIFFISFICLLTFFFVKSLNTPKTTSSSAIMRDNSLYLRLDKMPSISSRDSGYKHTVKITEIDFLVLYKEQKNSSYKQGPHKRVKFDNNGKAIDKLPLTIEFKNINPNIKTSYMINAFIILSDPNIFNYSATIKCNGEFWKSSSIGNADVYSYDININTEDYKKFITPFNPHHPIIIDSFSVRIN